MNLNYLSELSNLIRNGESIEEFIKLYKEHFNNEEPSKELIRNFQSNSLQYDSYQNSESYDDSYDDSYD